VFFCWKNKTNFFGNPKAGASYECVCVRERVCVCERESVCERMGVCDRECVRESVLCVFGISGTYSRM